MDIKGNKAESDLSSDSSWTIIDDSNTSIRNNSFVKVSPHLSNCNVTKEILEKELKDVNKNKSGNTSDIGDTSFLNFDEYSLERLAESSPFQPKVKRSKKKRKCVKKSCKDPLNILTIAACLLTITGITLLTTFLPPNYAESTELENFQKRLSEVYESSKVPTNENALNSLRTTMEAIDSATSMNVLNMIHQNLSNEEICEVSPEYYDNSSLQENISQFKLRILTPYLKEIYSDDQEGQGAVKVEEKINNNTGSLVQVAKNLIKSPSLQMFVATVIQDLCLIKLISEFSKRTKMDLKVEEKESTIDAKKENKKIKKIAGVSKKKSSLKKNEKVPKKKKSPTIASSGSPNQIILKDLNSVYQKESKIASENGKSECERRFEELDTRGALLGYNHRQKIQQIKDKFQKEIFQIKEQEKTRYNRTQKVSFTREKFLQRLKTDREIYLHRLRKIREERKKLLDAVCLGLNTPKDLGSKDASVGNYAVLLPKTYSFSKKIEELEATKEKPLKLETLNNETVSYIPFKNDSKINLEERQDVIKAKRTKAHRDKYCELKQKYLRKKAKILKRRQTQKQIEETKNLGTNMDNLFSNSSIKTLQEQTPVETGLHLYNIEENKVDEEGFQLVKKRKISKRNLNNLYQAAFGEQSKKIRQDDAIKWKWNKTNFDECISSQALISKHDPFKTHTPKITHKGVL